MINSKLNRILDTAKRTRYYNNIIDNFDYNLNTSTSLLTKEKLQVNSDHLLNPMYAGAMKSILNISRTSGTTGEFVEVYWRTDDYLRSNLCLWRERYRCYGVSVKDKFLSFHSLVYNGSRLMEPRDITSMNPKTNLSLSKFDFNPYTVSKYCKMIESFDPVWMFLQPSSALYFIQMLSEAKISPQKLMPHLKYIEVTGEVLLKSEKEYISNFFGVPVCNMYGCNELNTIAYECPFGHMHILDENVYVQIKNCGNTQSTDLQGTAIITSLHNTAMPIVAYDIGDFIRLKKNEGCECGKLTGYDIESIIGRSSEKIKFDNGKSISSYEITFCIEYVNSIMRNPILQFKVINHLNHILIQLKICESFNGWQDAIKMEIKNKIREYVEINEKNIDIVYVSEFEKNIHGKKSIVVEDPTIKKSMGKRKK